MPNLGVGSARVGNRTYMCRLSFITAQVAIETRALDWRGCQSCQRQETWTLLAGTIRDSVSPGTRGLGYFCSKVVSFSGLAAAASNIQILLHPLCSQGHKMAAMVASVASSNLLQRQNRRRGEPFPASDLTLPLVFLTEFVSPVPCLN